MENDVEHASVVMLRLVSWTMRGELKCGFPTERGFAGCERFLRAAGGRGLGGGGRVDDGGGMYY